MLSRLSRRYVEDVVSGVFESHFGSAKISRYMPISYVDARGQRSMAVECMWGGFFFVRAPDWEQLCLPTVVV